MSIEDLNHARLQDFGGTMRIVPPQETLRRITGAAQRAGITRVANVTGLDTVGVPTWMAVRPLARSLSVSQGKGASHLHAKVSAIMEAIELFHAEHLVPPGEIFSLAEASTSADCIPIDLLPLRPVAEVTASAQCQWIAGECLVTKRTRWLPRQVIDLDLVSRSEMESLFAASSTGLASGNSLAEATIHALCEVVERDHVAFWLVNQKLDPFHESRRIDIATINDPTCREHLDKIASAGLSVAVWDLTSKLGLPCFTASVFDQRSATFYLTRASGAGCHPKRDIALARAISEALQSRLTFISGIRDDVFWRAYSDEIAVEATYNRRWLEENCDVAAESDASEVKDFGSGTEDAQRLLGEICDALLAEGFDSIVRTDLSCVEFGVPVVHVFVPGMEPQLRPQDYSPGPRMVARLQEIRHL